MRDTRKVIEYIDNGLPVSLALQLESFTDVPEAKLEVLRDRARRVQAKTLISLYEAANDKRASAANRAKALETYIKIKAETEKSSQHITIVIQGEDA